MTSIRFVLRSTLRVWISAQPMAPPKCFLLSLGPGSRANIWVPGLARCGRLTLGFLDCVCIGFVLWVEEKVVFHWPQQHLAVRVR